MKTGVVKSVDAKTMIVAHEDGSTYMLPAKFKVADLKAGEKVKIDWQVVNTVNQAGAVTVVK